MEVDMKMGNQTLIRFLSSNPKPNQGSYQLPQSHLTKIPNLAPNPTFADAFAAVCVVAITSGPVGAGQLAFATTGARPRGSLFYEAPQNKRALQQRFANTQRAGRYVN
jgi:hypothetical protein